MEGNGVFVKKKTRLKVKIKFGNPSLRRLISGTIAGAVSRTCVAPLETIRTHLMVGSSGHSTIEVFQDIMQTEGWTGLFRGNLRNEVQTSQLSFTFKICIKFLLRILPVRLIIAIDFSFYRYITRAESIRMGYNDFGDFCYAQQNKAHLDPITIAKLQCAAGLAHLEFNSCYNLRTMDKRLHCLCKRKTQIRFILLQNRQGKTRLAKYYIHLEESEKHKVEYEVHRLVVNRDPKFTNFVEVYRTSFEF
ncbi:hypothetical protein L1987_01980 [Smallanthus sonchifolius]|uniref:Uncharacterized protein n=1 Tax=Smallanthus sonchifolius TaxID=185202 RepID=A0ACB9K6Q7_9ASTR|nr:hypothetical protein L1987_01980 [Smallanthus sonchifolius]